MQLVTKGNFHPGGPLELPAALACRRDASTHCASNAAVDGLGVGAARRRSYGSGQNTRRDTQNQRVTCGGCRSTPTLNLTSKLNLWVLLRGAVAALPSSQRSREVINERHEDQG